MLLHYVIEYRLDFLAFALLAIGAASLCQSAIRRRRPAASLPRETWRLLIISVVLSGGFAEWASHARRQNLVKMFTGFSSTYASELQELGHAQVTLETPADDPRYLRIIAAEKRWLALNPNIADIYTFRQDADGTVRLIVDAETDYDHNHVLEGEAEARTAIGEVYEEITPNFLRALRGETIFDPVVVTDRWGSWVSAYAPLRDDRGHIEGAVGIDYSAHAWLWMIALSRSPMLALCSVLITILLWRVTSLTLLRAELRERRVAQARLEREKETGEIVARARTEVVALISHEIRTPLNAVMGFSSALTDTALDTTQRRYVETVVDAGDRMITLVDAMLDASRTGPTRLPVQPVACAPAVVVHDVLALLRESATEKGLKLNFENRAGPVLNVESDPVRLRQLLFNLVGNAIRFTERGVVTVRVDWTPPAQDDCMGSLRLRVIDAGVGMAPDRLHALFQADPTATVGRDWRARASGGLGLAVCRRVVEALNGSLTAESVPAHGTTVTVTLPCLPAVAAAKNSISIDRANAPGRVLVVDDLALNRELLRVLLRRCGYESDLAVGGTEAVRLAGRNQYAAILTDIEMPDMDGLTATGRIRANEPPGSRVPIIAVTSRTDKDMRDRCLAAGMDEYLTKPIYPPALKSTLEALVQARSLAG